MTRLPRSLAVLTSVAVAAGTLFGSIAALHACPYRALKTPQNSVQQPTPQNAMLRAQKPPQSQPFNQAGLLSLGAVAGLLAISGAYLLSQRRSSTLWVNVPLTQHPELDHPELTLTSLPHEALPTAPDDQELVLTR
jgi:hypothetical protein